jgi:hypothetical protein
LGKLLSTKPRSNLPSENILASCIRNHLAGYFFQIDQEHFDSDVAAFAIVELIREDFKNLFGCDEQFTLSVSSLHTQSSHIVSIDIWEWASFISKCGVKVDTNSFHPIKV